MEQTTRRKLEIAPESHKPKAASYQPDAPKPSGDLGGGPGRLWRRLALGRGGRFSYILVLAAGGSIVRSTTMKELVHRISARTRAREVHVRVACPPIIAPCFYGIDMSTFKELFAPRYVPPGYKGSPTPQMLSRMAKALGVNSLRYLEVSDLAPCIQIDGGKICTGCVTGKQPTPMGKVLIKRVLNSKPGSGRTYEQAPAAVPKKGRKRRG